jgi:isoleucyl-tRNA synthetase
VSDRIRLGLLFDDAADAEAVAAAFDAADVAGETLAVAHTVRTRVAELLSASDVEGAGAEYETVVAGGTYANTGPFTVSVSRIGVGA